MNWLRMQVVQKFHKLCGCTRANGRLKFTLSKIISSLCVFYFFPRRFPFMGFVGVLPPLELLFLLLFWVGVVFVVVRPVGSVA